MLAQRVKMNKTRLPLSLLILALAVSPVLAFDPASVNGANYEMSAGSSSKEPDAAVLKLQIMLDQAHFSPGVIDGRMGDNTVYALREFEKQSGLASDGRLDQDVWNALSTGNPKVLVTYTLTEADTKGPFVKSIPKDYAAMAVLDSLSYTSVEELLGEKFHLDIALLKALNPGARLDHPGEKILVPNVVNVGPKGEVTNIEIDKARSVLRGYGRDGKLLVVYPASIGSEENPSPRGKMTVKGVARNPKYSYRPDKNFQQQGNLEPLTLPPGPNGPVGSIWIDLTKETYGVHGTANPELVGKTLSHGCVRLTNWDAEELGRLVKFGTKVSFLE
jgi:lipoprotein-anchoring transpeptidase ErfK/SrfK